jgi:hypothetical protein
LERICGLYAEFGTNSTGGCGPFDGFSHFMCPNAYEVLTICAIMANQTTVGDVGDVTTEEFCSSTFGHLSDNGEVPSCESLCTAYVVDAGCCTIDCN